MHFTKPRELVIPAIAGFALGYLSLDVAYDALPALPAAAGIPLAILAAAEFILAMLVRARIRAGKVLTAIAIGRTAMLAKASSLLAALMAGAWGGALVYAAPQASYVAAAEADLPAMIVGVASSILLLGAALWLEHCCRTPHFGEPDFRRDRDPDSHRE